MHLKLLQKSFTVSVVNDGEIVGHLLWRIRNSASTCGVLATLRINKVTGIEVISTKQT